MGETSERRITLGSLFSGVGGLDLGLEMALRECGYEPTTVFQVEREEYPSKILARHWPHAVRYDDVCTVGAVARERDERDPPGPAIVHALPRVDVLNFGFPCTDLSFAGKGAGLDGAASGLWFEGLRIIRELRPRAVVVENVPALAKRGLGVVLGGLAQERYDAVWFCVAAADVGAPQLRERIFIIAWDTDGSTAEVGPPHVSDPCCKGLEGHGRSDEHDCAGEGAGGGADAGGVLGDEQGGPKRRVGSATAWATPAASDVRDRGNPDSPAIQRRVAAGKQVMLSMQVQRRDAATDGANWPTPRVSCANGPSQAEIDADDPKHRLETAVVVQELRWPTPCVTDSFGARNATCSRAEGSNHHDGRTLLDEVILLGGEPRAVTDASMALADVYQSPRGAVELWQTPTVGCVTGGQKTRGGDRANELLLNGQAMVGVGAAKGLFLNPQWVECLQSFPDGWTERPEVHTEPFAGVWHGWPARPNEPQHPWEVPRVTTDTKARKHRLKALGNAVVPEVARAVGHVLAEILAMLGEQIT